MLKIGITGQAGFIGTHLFNTLGLFPDVYEGIPFEDRFFSSPTDLQAFVKKCDVIVHLAALNRHNDPEEIFRTNIELVEKLIAAMEATGSAPHVLFSSSTQEERDNVYGRSKKEGRMRFEAWAARTGARFTGLVIPNVFGPFGNPFYNSVVATFCHQLTHDEQPRIDQDGELKLIYVGELVREILNLLIATNPEKVKTVWVQPTSAIRVSELLSKLESFKSGYLKNGILPDLSDSFNRNLFNTFLCYADHKTLFPFPLKLNTDDRGSFVEVVKLGSGGQVSFSTTRPGITRGNHFHTRKAERFAVIRGKACIELRRKGSEDILTFDLDGENPSFVDMPVWYTHNIKNTGTEDLYTLFWISEFFDPADPDTFFEAVRNI
jgi:UDP-2-acetamido-2,6-beta-L-arabino-hexul-4-ose reductase